MEKIISLKNRAFRKIYKYGKSVANPLLILYTLNNTFDYKRLGICSSKTVGNSVMRHRATRLVREAFRHVEGKIKPSFDLVLITRKPILEKKEMEVEEALIDLLKKAGIYI